MTTVLTMVSFNQNKIFLFKFIKINKRLHLFGLQTQVYLKFLMLKE